VFEVLFEDEKKGWKVTELWINISF